MPKLESLFTRAAFIIKPHMQSVITIEDPPAEKNGSGIPVEGIATKTTATLAMDWKKIAEIHPKVPISPKRSVQFNANL